MGRAPASVAERSTRGTGVITSFGGLHLTGVVQVTGRWGGLLPASSWSTSAQMETPDADYARPIAVSVRAAACGQITPFCVRGLTALLRGLPRSGRRRRSRATWAEAVAMLT